MDVWPAGGLAGKVGTPDAKVFENLAPARQDGMGERKSSTGFFKLAAAHREAKWLLGDTANPDTQLAQGLYDPALDKDSCGVGFIADIKGRKTHQTVEDGLQILCNLEHRGATGADPRMGDGAGILVQIPHKFFAKEAATTRLRFAQARRIRGRPIVPAARSELAADHPRHLCGDDRAATG